MKHLLTILLFCSVVSNIIAEDLYEYKTNKDESITITKYKGPRDVEEIAVPKIIDGFYVKQINSLLGSDASNVEKVYIPSDIKINGSINNNQITIKCGVLDDNLTFADIGYPFYYSSQNNYAELKCIYTLGTKVYSSLQLTGYEKSFLFHLGSITVVMRNDVSETIQMYNWGKDYPTRALVDQTRFEYLIWALEQHLTYMDYTLEDIKEIDLSNLTNKPNGNTEVNFDFGDYNPASALNYGAKVIVNANNYTNTPENITIADLQNYSLPVTDINPTIHYFRDNTQDWNSVCLPFDLNENDFDANSNTKIYTILGADDQSIKLTRTESIVAGTPCFIHSDAESWNLTLQNREIKSTTQAGTIEIGGWKMFGSFTWKIIGADKYKLNEDGKSISPTANDDAHVSPFRCYLECTSASGAPERFAVSIEGEEQSITFTKEDSDTTDLIYFDLMGHPIQNNDEPRLLKGRNIIIR